MTMRRSWGGGVGSRTISSISTAAADKGALLGYCRTRTEHPSATPTVEQLTVVESTALTMEECSTTRPTSPGSGLHDEGDPSVEEAWDAMVTSSGLARAGTEPTGDEPSSAT